MDGIVAVIGDLPAAPGIVTMLMSLTSSMETNIDRIAHALMADQSLTVRVLRMANASFYGRTKEVRTPKEAVVILGLKTLRSLVVAMSTQSLFKDVGKSRIQTLLWEHALAAAVCSRQIAGAAGFGRTDEAFIAGLLHDIGKLVLLHKMTDAYTKIIESIERSGGEFSDMEDETFGFTHADIGLLLLNKWAFPEELASAVAAHHYTTEPTAQNSSLPDIVRLANYMAKHLGGGFNDYRPVDLALLPSALALKLDAERVSQIQSRAAEMLAAEKLLFQQ